MSIHELQEGIAWSVGWQRVGGRVIAVEPVLSVLVGSEFSAQVVRGLVVRVLEVVFAVGASLPNIEHGSGNGLSGEKICDCAVHESDLATRSWVLDDGAAIVAEWRIGRPEGSKDRGRSRINVAFSDNLVCDFINQAMRQLASSARRHRCVSGVYSRFKSKDVRDSVRLIASLGRYLSHGVDKMHTSHPLIVGEFYLSRKVVEMADQAAKDYAVARCDIGAHGVKDMLGEVWVKAGLPVGSHFEVCMKGCDQALRYNEEEWGR